jgi:hypothetical protein
VVQFREAAAENRSSGEVRMWEWEWEWEWEGGVSGMSKKEARSSTAGKDCEDEDVSGRRSGVGEMWNDMVSGDMSGWDGRFRRCKIWVAGEGVGVAGEE